MLSLSVPAQAQRKSLDFFAVTTNNKLLRIDMKEQSFFNGRKTVLELKNSRSITGLTAGDSIVGIDFRPATGELLALTNNAGTGRLYTINTSNGAASLKSTLAADPADQTAPFPFTALSGTQFGIDFNPTVDRLRVVSNADQNLRINVDTGATQLDGALNYAVGDPNQGDNPNVVGSGYTNSSAGPPNPVDPPRTTTLYGIDTDQDILVLQAPPNDGTLVTQGSLGVNLSDLLGFDIAPSDNTAVVVTGTGGTANLYFINLSSGKAKLIGNVKTKDTVRGIAIPLNQ